MEYYNIEAKYVGHS